MQGPVKKIVVLSWNDRWSESLYKTFEHLVETVIVLRADILKPHEVKLQVEQLKPDLCFAKNFRVANISDGHAPACDDWHTIFSEWNFPVAIWYLDNPVYQDSFDLKRYWATRPRAPHLLFFYNDPSFGSFFSKQGLPAHHLPIGVDEVIARHRFPLLEMQFKAPLRFTGHALSSCSLPEISVPMLTEGHLSLYLTNVEGLLRKVGISAQSLNSEIAMIENALRDFFSSFYNQPESFITARDRFYKQCKQLTLPASYSALQLDEGFLGEVYSWWQMTCYLYHLQDKGLRVQGSPEWQAFFPKQQEFCRELSWEELFASYRAADISFCFTKWSLPHAVHDRIYEVLLAGGFPLTDYRSELQNQFEMDEIAVYQTIEEARDLIDFYLKHPGLRTILSEKGRSRVLKCHTYRHRLHDLLQVAAKHFSIGSTSVPLTPKTQPPIAADQQ